MGALCEPSPPEAYTSGRLVGRPPGFGPLFSPYGVHPHAGETRKLFTEARWCLPTPPAERIHLRNPWYFFASDAWSSTPTTAPPGGNSGARLSTCDLFVETTYIVSKT
jgi:hypothetical protein